METVVRRLPVFSPDIVTTCITMQDVRDRLNNDYVLTPYHHQVLLLEIAEYGEAKKALAKDLRLPDGSFSRAKKHKALRTELIILIRDQQDLRKMLAHAKTLYFEFKKMRRAGTVPPILNDMFKVTLDKLWEARRQQQAVARIQEIDDNLEKHATEDLMEERGVN